MDDKMYEEPLGSPAASDFLGSEAELQPSYAQSNGSGVTGFSGLDELNLQTETVEVDPSADATAAPPPIPDGIHEFNLLPVDISSYGKDGAKWGAAREKGDDGKRKPDGRIDHLWASLEYEAVEPGKPYDKSHVFENYVSTLVGQRTGTSRVATLNVKLGLTVPKRATHMDHMKQLLQESQKRPAIALETQWEAQCQTCGEKARVAGEKYPKPFLRGDRNFPMDEKTKQRDTEVPCPVCKTLVQARAQVVHYHRSKRAQSQVAAGAQAFDATL